MKLLALMATLQPSDYHAVEKFLRSPFFKASDQYVKFFRFLLKHYPELNLEKAEMKAVFMRCFGKAYFSETKFYNVISGLSSQLEQYLVVNMVLENNGRDTGGLFDTLLSRALGERNSGAYFRKKTTDLIDTLNALPAKEIEDYWSIYHLHQQLYFNPDTPKFGLMVEHLTQASEFLDLYYSQAKLRLSAEMKARERILQTRFENALLDPIMAWSEAVAAREQHPTLAIYCQVIQLYHDGLDQASFHDLLLQFTSQFQQLAKREQQSIIRHLINGGISLISRNAAVEKEMLTLYQLAIQENILLDGGRITPQSFVNISNLAGICREFQWAAGFIEQFSPFLEPGARQAAVDLSRAGLYYHQQQLDEAQLLLNAEVFNIPPFDLLSRNLLLKIAFDRFLKYPEGLAFLQAHMKAYERYVQLKPLTSDKKQAELNWIKFVRKMTTRKLEQGRFSSQAKQELREKLTALQPIVSKKWLESKMDEL